MVASTFGELLRRYRLAAGLTQRDLARRAGLSLNAINLLERGERQRPYRHTVTALIPPLGLDDAQRNAFELAADRYGGSLTQVVAALPAPDRAILARASIFAGGWPPPAAERVCGAPEGDGPPVLTRLVALADMGLVTVHSHAGVRRYAMPAPVHELASVHLAASGEADAIGCQHTRWCLDVASMAEAANRQADVATLDRCAAEVENLGQAIVRGEATPECAAASLRLAAAVALLLGMHHGELTLAMVWLRRALSLAPRPDAMRARSMALTRMSRIAFRLRDFRLAAAAAADAARIQRRLGPRDWLPTTIDSLGHAHWAHANPAAGLPMFREEIELARESGDLLDLARGLRSAAAAVWRIAGPRPAAVLFRESLEAAERAGDREHGVLALSGLGCVVAETGDVEAGEALVTEAVEKARALGVPSLTARTLVRCGFVHLLAHGGEAAAQPLLREALRMGRDVAPMWRRHALVGLAIIATTAGAEQEALRLMIEVGRVEADSMEWDPHARRVIAEHAGHLNQLSAN